MNYRPVITRDDLECIQCRKREAFITGTGKEVQPLGCRFMVICQCGYYDWLEAWTPRDALTEYQWMIKYTNQEREAMQASLFTSDSINLTEFIGVTEFADGKPPSVGWWDTRLSYEDGEVSTSIRRRHWDGKRWSFPVRVGDDNEVDAEHNKELPASLPAGASIQWRGLKERVESAMPPANPHNWSNKRNKIGA